MHKKLTIIPANPDSNGIVAVQLFSYIARIKNRDSINQHFSQKLISLVF